MKKIILFFCLFNLSINNILATEFDIEITEKDNNLILNILVDGKKVSQEEASEKYGFDKYFHTVYQYKDVYFSNGLEITKEDFVIGYEEEKINKKCEEYQSRCRIVHDEKEILSSIDEIYSKHLTGEFHLLYTNKTYESLNLSSIKEKLKNKYVYDITKNYFTYSQYGIVNPIHFDPIINEEEIIINGGLNKLSLEEEKKLQTFGEEVKKAFSGLTEEEIIYIAYKFISEHTTYDSKGVYNDYLIANLSAYDVIFKKMGTCISNSTTISYFLDLFGINSYIIDVVGKIDEESKTYETTHTYNLVKLDNKWYVVDVEYKSLSGLLKSTKNIQNNVNLDLNYSFDDYYQNHDVPNIQNYYEKIENIINKINSEEISEVKKDSESKNEATNDTFLCYFVFFQVLVIIGLIIFIFTRKK